MKDCYSTDNEEFHDGDLHDAIRNLGLQAGDTVWMGESHPAKASGWVDADDVLETLRDRADADFGEMVGDDYPEVSDEAKEELNTFLANWLDTHCTPPFYHVRNSEKCAITPEEIDHALQP